MAFVDDEQLLALSVSPKQSLFPVLIRAEALSPLIVLLAFLPPLYVLAHQTLSPVDALWGLKAVRLGISDSPAVWLDPSLAEAPNDPKSNDPKSDPKAEAIPLKWQPPLVSWMTAGVMKWIGTDRPLALSVVSSTATFALIGLMFCLAMRLRGPKFAWWTTCLTALYGPLLQGAQSPAPVSLTLAFAVAACWGFVRHCQDSKRLVSWSLFGTAVAWGLCLLSGGPVALVLVAILLLYVFSQFRSPKPAVKSKAGKSKRVWKGQPALFALGIALVIGLLIGGWWEFWMFSRHKAAFQNEWFAATSSLSTHHLTNTGIARQLLQDLSQMGGALIGLVVLGLGVAASQLRNVEGTTSGSDRHALAFILAWAFCAGLVWFSHRAGTHPSDAFTTVWRGFCLIPILLLSALAIEQITERRIGILGVFFGATLTIFVLLIIPVEIGFGLSAEPRPLWKSLWPLMRGTSDPSEHLALKILGRLTFGLSILASAGWLLARFLKQNDFRQRVFLQIALGLFLSAHAVFGFLGVRQATPEDGVLNRLREEMRKEPRVARWTIVSPKTSPPLTVQFVLTSLWPRVESMEMKAWWDKQLTRELSETPAENGAHLFVDWSEHDTRPPTLRITDAANTSHLIEFEPLGSPHILGDHRLQFYRLTDRLIQEK